MRNDMLSLGHYIDTRWEFQLNTNHPPLLLGLLVLKNKWLEQELTLRHHGTQESLFINICTFVDARLACGLGS
jgi:hypothetical protein